MVEASMGVFTIFDVLYVCALISLNLFIIYSDHVYSEDLD